MNLTRLGGSTDAENDEWDKHQYDDGALERYVRSLNNQKLVFAPGTDFSYSNMAFEVLGDVIAEVYGKGFDDQVKHHTLMPLRMKDSTLLVKKSNSKLMTWGHSNVEDIARWARF